MHVHQEADVAAALASLHAMGLRFVVEREVLADAWAPTPEELRAAIARRNEYWINEDFDEEQQLNADLVDDEMVRAFVVALPRQPATMIASLVAAVPIDLAGTTLGLRRGLDVGPASLRRAWTLVWEWGAPRLVADVDADHVRRLSAIAASEELVRQARVAALDAASDRTDAAEAARETARRGLWSVQRCRLALARARHALEPDPGVATDIARLEAALVNAPAWGSRLPPPP